MSELPKLKVTNWCGYGYPKEEIMDLEQARDLLNFDPTMQVIVEGQVLVYYDELVRLAAQDRYRTKEFLVVEVIGLASGG